MPVERLDAREHFAVIPTRDQDLCVGTDGGLKDREGSGGEFVFLELRDFVLSVIC